MRSTGIAGLVVLAAVPIRDPSVGKKLLFGALAGDRKQDFLTLTTETESDARSVWDW